MFPTDSQVMGMLLVWRPHSENHHCGHMCPLSRYGSIEAWGLEGFVAHQVQKMELCKYIDDALDKYRCHKENQVG